MPNYSKESFEAAIQFAIVKQRITLPEIVDTDSPIKFETSFIVKKGLFSELVMVVKWS